MTCRRDKRDEAQLHLLVPGAVVQTTGHVGAWRRHARLRTRRRTSRARASHLSTHVGRNVGLAAALITEGQVAHIQLISHDCS